MINLRKFKKKKKSKALNPEELAQQKLFEISRFSDQQDSNEPDIFLQNLQPKNISKNQTPFKKRILTHPTSDAFTQQFRKRRMGSTLSINELKHRSSQILSKHPVSITNFLLIDDRDKKSVQEFREKSLKVDCSLLIKRRTVKTPSNKLSLNRSCDLKKQVEKDQLKSVKQGINSVIQIKNIKLFSKYPLFFSH